MEDIGNETQPEVGATASAETTPKEETPTAEEQMKPLQAQLDVANAEREKLEKSYKGLQSVLNKTNEEYKRQSDLRADIEGLKETQKILAGMLQEARAVPEENLDNMPQGKKQDYLKQFEDAQKRIEMKRQMDEAQAKIMSYKTKLETLGLKDDDELYWEIEDLVTRGKYSYADAKLKKLESKKETEMPKDEKKQEAVPTEAQIEAYLKSKGLLKTETVTSAGGGRTGVQIRQDYIQGKITSEQRDKELRALGINPVP